MKKVITRSIGLAIFLLTTLSAGSQAKIAGYL